MHDDCLVTREIDLLSLHPCLQFQAGSRDLEMYVLRKPEPLCWCLCCYWSCLAWGPALPAYGAYELHCAFPTQYF